MAPPEVKKLDARLFREARPVSGAKYFHTNRPTTTTTVAAHAIPITAPADNAMPDPSLTFENSQCGPSQSSVQSHPACLFD